jgi:NAD(P)H-dependent nitrite reductase small subunit
MTAAEITRPMPSDLVDAIPDPSGPAWVPVCRWEDLVPDRGVCALVDRRPVAVYRCSFGSGLYALDNVDPFSGASVLSRGLVGVGADGVAFVASPLRKQRFALSTGRALDDPSVAVRPWAATVVDGVVVVAAPTPARVDATITLGQ